MTQHHLGFQLLDGLKGNAHNNDDRSAAQGQAIHAGHVGIDNRNQGHKSQEQGPDQGDFGKDLRDKVRRGLAGADARDGAVVLAEIIGHFQRLYWMDI